VISWRILAVDEMLIEQVVGTVCTLLVEAAFGLGSAELDTIYLGLLCRLFLYGALLEALQVDQVPHRRSRFCEISRYARRPQTGAKINGNVVL
jgi:hypothetical protein